MQTHALTTCLMLLALVFALSIHSEGLALQKRQNPALVPIEDEPSLPRVLIIGDSISMGYTLPTRELLKGKANLHRPPTNCGPTTTGLDQLEAWLGDKPWDVIHFNWGLHDLKYMDEKGQLVDAKDGKQQAPLPLIHI